MKFNWINRAAELEKSGEPFAIATVIDTVAPTSAKPMAKAIITAEGKMEGWIGGGCAKDNVIEEALKCLETGMATVLRLSPDQLSDGNVSYKKDILLICESGGTLEFHIEPILPMIKLIIYGKTPAASALAQMGLMLDYDVHVIDPGIAKLDLPDAVKSFSEYKKIGGKCVALVATQGEGDLAALTAAIECKPEYLSLIASKKKTRSLIEQLLKQGINKTELELIKFPAGLDIGAVTPEEIAVSIMAELVQYNRSVSESDAVIIEVDDTDQLKEKDPICGMLVDTQSADHYSEFKGKLYYFCCHGCKEKFQVEPVNYIL